MNAHLLRMLAVVLMLIASASPLMAQDLDEDGLPDDLERELIDRHRPLLLYDNEEDFWPSTLTWFVQRSNLQFRCDTSLGVSYEYTLIPRSTLQQDPWLALSACVNDSQCTNSPQCANWIKDPALGQIFFDLLDSARTGQGPLPVGMYAHVVPIVGPVERPCFVNSPTTVVIPAGQMAILLSYWQFFPHNEGRVCFDHEGDWLRLDVYLSMDSDHSLLAIIYDPHGSTKPDECLFGTVLPDDGVPRCYIEDDSHEWYSGSGSGPCFSDHDGDGVHIRAAPGEIINLGERYAPLCEWFETPDLETSLALFFNGDWGAEGDNPAGPTTQAAWRYPSPIHGTATARYVDLAAPQVNLSAYPDNHFAAGSRYFPYHTVAKGVAEVAPGGTVRVAPGVYPENMTISKAVTLEAMTGGVTIGK